MSFTYFLPAFFGVLLGAITVRGGVVKLRQKGPLGEVLITAILFGALEVAVHSFERPRWVDVLLVLGTFAAICGYAGARLARHSG